MTTAGQGRDATLEPSTEAHAVEVPEDAPAQPAATPGSVSDGVLVRRGGIGPRLSAIALGVVVAAGALYGVLLHVWLLVHLPIWGDEAIVGLMAQSIDNGHFSAFYWGQHYGGLEPYLVAAALKIGGGGEPALNATPAVLAALAAVLVAGIGLAGGRDRLTAAAAGTAVWVWPYVVVWQSVREGGFREATLCCGLAAILCCVRVSRDRAGPWTFLLLGVALGLGWWASPEIVYFVPACLVLLWGWVRHASQRWSSLALVVLGVIVGSVPWWYANAHTGFVSLQRSALPANGGITYGTKLSVFFHDMLPLQLGLRTVVGGNWVGGTSFGVTLYVAALAIIAAAVVRSILLFVRDSSERVSLALAVAVVCFPFLYAAAPGTGYWFDGRYGIYFPALVVALFITTPLRPLWPLDRRMRATPSGPTQRTLLRRSHVVAAAGLACAVCLTVIGAHDEGVPASASFLSSWHNGDAPMEQVLSTMRAHHIEDAYGDYWTAYDLDFLSGGHPVVSPSPLLDVTRSVSIAATVAHSKDPAWLFFAPAQTATAAAVFANPQPGPGPYTERTFEALLTQQGISYSVVPLGVLDAVVPVRRVITP